MSQSGQSAECNATSYIMNMFLKKWIFFFFGGKLEQKGNSVGSLEQKKLLLIVESSNLTT